MIKLLQIEWLKHRTNLPFWLLLGIYFVSMYVACSLGTILINATMSITTSGDAPPQIPDFNIYDYPEIWHNLAYLSSFVKVFLGIIVISSISNEISFKTMKQNIMDGMSQLEFLLSKSLMILVLSILSTVALSILISYFGSNYAETVGTSFDNEKADFIFGHFIQILTFLSFCLFVGIMIKQTGLAIVFVLVWSLFLETVVFGLALGFDNQVATFMPIHVINDIVSAPFSIMNPDEVQTHVTGESVLLGMCWTAIFLGLSYLRLKFKDL